MDQVTELLASNAAILFSVVALFVSLRANFIAHKAHKLNMRNKEDSDQVLLAEKKREVLNELDRQHATLATLSFVTEQQIILFDECTQLNRLLPDERGRLLANLQSVDALEKSYDVQRASAGAFSAASDIPKLDDVLGTVRRLSIHLEKDIAHEKMLLDQLRHLVATAPPAHPTPHRPTDDGASSQC